MSNSFKKTLGVIIIVISIFFGLISISPLISYFIGSSDRELQRLLTEVIFIGVASILGFNFGMKLFRSGKKQELPAGLVDVYPRDTVRIEVQISKKEFIMLSFRLAYSKPFMIYITSFGVLNLAALMHDFQGFNSSVFFVLVVLLMPGMIYFQANKNYNTQKIVKEKIRYEFNKYNIIQNGETFNSTIKWSGLQKASETANWYLLYTNPLTAFFIPKESFASEEQKEKFRAMIWNTEGIRKEIK